MILFIDACVRAESRTRRLAEKYLSKLDGEVETVRLDEIVFPVANEDFLSRRDRLIAEGATDDGMFALAAQFARADEIVIAAPLWDLSFPASLKQYFEQINVIGVTFYYTPEGVPSGLCLAKRLTYVTTCGGDYFPEEFGFGYVKALTKGLFGIKEAVLVKAEGLDIDGADEKAVLERAKEKIVQITA